MAYYVNRVTLAGNLGQNPEIKVSQNGNQYCSFSLATSSSYMDKQTQQWQNTTEWHRCITYLPRLVAVLQTLQKGAYVMVEGEIRYSTYTGQDGIQRKDVSIHVNDVFCLNHVRVDNDGSTGYAGNQGSYGGNFAGNQGFNNASSFAGSNYNNQQRSMNSGNQGFGGNAGFAGQGNQGASFANVPQTTTFGGAATGAFGGQGQATGAFANAAPASSFAGATKANPSFAATPANSFGGAKSNTGFGAASTTPATNTFAGTATGAFASSSSVGGSANPFASAASAFGNATPATTPAASFSAKESASDTAPKKEKEKEKDKEDKATADSTIPF